jgi:conjugative transposon TraN protein
MGIMVAGKLTAQSNFPLQQKFTPIKQEQVINLIPVEVCYDMTTHIVFPNEISYVDLGNADIISEKAEKVGNVLKLKANKKNFVGTNMTVITSDGKYFAFMVSYVEIPNVLNIKLSSADFSAVSRKVMLGNYDSTKSIAVFDEVKMNEGEMNKYAYELVKKRRHLRHLGQEKYDMQVNIKNIYVKDNVLFFSFYFKNASEVNYDIDFIKFYIKDAAIAKRTAQQELEVLPIYAFDPDHTETIAGKTKNTKVYCFQRFTIPDKKVFTIEVFEKNGGRKFSFDIMNKDIIEAIEF